jgi:hypothetical protein
MFHYLVFPGIDEIVDVFRIIEVIEGIAILETDLLVVDEGVLSME